jgi:hypothetical protein
MSREHLVVALYWGWQTPRGLGTIKVKNQTVPLLPHFLMQIEIGNLHRKAYNLARHPGWLVLSRDRRGV